MVSDSFDPYHEWLGLAPNGVAPNYYQLLGLSPTESNRQAIATAADRAMTRVRSFRPGKHARDWAQVLDEIAEAKRCLLDDSVRAQYDASLENDNESASSLRSTIRPAEVPGAYSPDMYPPGYAPGKPTAALTTSNTNPLGHAYEVPASGDPMAPVPMAVPVAEFSTAHSAGTASSQVPMAIPIAQLVPSQVGQPVPIATGIPVSGPVRAQAAPSLLAPTVEPPQPDPAVRVPSTPAIVRAERKSARQMPLLITIAASLIVVTLVIVGLLLKDKGKQVNVPSQVARNDSAGEPAGGKSSQNASATSARSKTAPKEPTKSPTRSATTETSVPPRSSVEPSEPATFPAPATNEPPSEPVSLTPTTPTVPANTPAAPAVTPTPQPTANTASPMPTDQDVARLAKALKEAREALSNRKVSTAEKVLESVAAIPRLKDHDLKYQRLGQLTKYVKDFNNRVAQSARGLRAATEIKVGSTFVSVVEVTPQLIIVRVAGTNRRYPLYEIPPKLAVAIADMSTPQDATALLAKGAFVLSLADAPEELREEARNWWKRAGVEMPQIVEEILPVLEDEYDL